MDMNEKIRAARERKAKRTAKRKLLFAGKPQAISKTVLKKKLWAEYGPGVLEIVKKSGKRFKVTETVRGKAV